CLFVPVECEPDRRHQIPQRLTHASACFYYQMLFLLQRLRDARCHLLLLRTELKVLRFREGAFLGKKCANAFHELAAEIVFQRDHDEEMTKHPPSPSFGAAGE